MRLTALVVLGLVLAAGALAAPAFARGNPDVAALQVALRARGLYGASVDGIEGRRTRAAVRAFQRRAGLAVDGIAGPRTRAALGRLGRPALGSRAIRRGAVGWDVAAFQFLLAWQGFPSGAFDGAFGPRTEGALRRYQRWARLGVDGIAGPATLASLGSPPPRSTLALSSPIARRVTGRFGPRGARFHTGIDFATAHGAPVVAARAGRVAYAGWHPGGWGYLVAIKHGRGVRTLYAHLSSLHARIRQRVRAGAHIGHVGASGSASGPHLHFEVRVRGAAVDPLTALR